MNKKANAELDVLLKKIAAGDEEAFKKLYDLTHNSVYFYLFRILKDKDLAEDVIVETYTAVWKGARKFEGRSKVQTWIFGIARNLAFNEFKKRKPADSIDDYPHLATNGRLSVEAVDRRRVVEQALQKISPKHREVLDLVFFHGFSYAEIGETLKVSVNTVKTRVFYAKKALYKTFDEMGVKKDDL